MLESTFDGRGAGRSEKAEIAGRVFFQKFKSNIHYHQNAMRTREARVRPPSLIPLFQRALFADVVVDA
jgi:hypothetical protein